MNLLNILIGLCVIGTITGAFFSDKNGKTKQSRQMYLLALFLSFISVLIELANLDLNTGDASLYKAVFYEWKNLSIIQLFLTTNKEIGFSLFSWISSQIMGYSSYRVLVYILQSTLVLLCVKNIFTDNYYLPFISYMWYPFFLSYVMVAIRQGISLCIFLYIISILYRQHLYSPKKRTNRLFFKIFFFLAVMVSFHSSSLLMIPGIIFLCVVVFKKDYKQKLLYISIFTFLISISMIFRDFIIIAFDNILFPKMDNYYSDTASRLYGKAGVRWDFIIFAIIPYCFYLVYNKWEKRFDILNLSYLYAFFAFLPFSAMAYCDRIAVYTFFQMPLLMICGFNKKNNVLTKNLFTCFLIATTITRKFMIIKGGSFAF
jgi:hypothetical protein